MKNKITLIIGASENPERYSFKAANALENNHFEYLLLGNKEGKINKINIQTGYPNFKNIHTVSLYLNPIHQKDYYDYVLKLKPKRVLFNPGTENQEFYNILIANGIKAENACTLVLLSLKAYFNE